MNRKLSLFLTLFALLTIVLSTSGHAQASKLSDSILTGYYTILGHEGIGVRGGSTSPGTPPSVGDYGIDSTMCRYIDVANTSWGQYWLLYPLHLPNGVTITTVKAFVADYNTNSGGTLFVHMVSRPWNSRSSGTDFGGSIGTSAGAAGDQTITRSGLSTVVNNQTTSYWIEMTPVNSSNPGQLCVYSVQVTYTYSGALLPLVFR
jgi:hypothetical protein